MKAASAEASTGLPPEDVLLRLRIPFVQRATFTHKGKSEDVFIIDLGLLGVFAERRETLPVGEAVVLRFPLPGNEIPIVARCRVAWCHDAAQRLASKQLPPGLGLEFVELTDKDRARIREHVEAHCRQNPRVRRFLRHWPEGKVKGDDPLAEEE